MAKTTSKTSSKTGGSVKYSDIVKVQGGVAVNPQTGAKGYAQGYEPKGGGGGNYAVRGANSELIRDFDPGKPPSDSDSEVPSLAAPNSLLEQAQPQKTLPGQDPNTDMANQPQVGQTQVAGSTQPRSVMNPITGQMETQAGPSPIQQGFGAAVASGMPVPQTQGDAFSAMSQFMPHQGPDFSAMDMQLAGDPAYQSLLKTYQEFNDVQNQRKSLTDEYKSMSKALGIQEMNTELMNMKNIIDGTEDDIRNEVTKAGGFATDSQVLALSFSRNKQLVKNYNNLLETKQQAQEQLGTMMNLAAQDKQMAMQAIGQKLQIQGQIIKYRDDMKKNAVDAYDRIIERSGYDGLEAMTNGDPYYTSLVEKTLGLGRGGLSMLSQQDRQKRSMDQWQQEFENQLAVDKFSLDQDKFAWDQQKDMNAGVPTSWQEINGQRVLVNDQTGEIIKNPTATQMGDPASQARVKSNIDQISGLLTDKGLNSSVGPNFLGRTSIWNRLTGTKSNFVAGIEQLRSQLTLDSLIKAKAQGATFGALSEGEMRVLEASASKLGTWAIKDKSGQVVGYNTSETAFRKELDKINNFAKLDFIARGGNPAEVGIQQTGDGRWVAPSSDGGGYDLTKEVNQYKQQQSGFTQAGNASASTGFNQVKGATVTAKALPLVKLDNQKAVPLPQAYPPGSTGGQCGVWVRSVVERSGKSYPRVGDSLAQKAATAKRYGVSLNQARPGSVVLTSENKTNGHVAYIIGRNQKGFILAESNYGLNGKVSYGRVLPFNSPKLLGIINPS